MPITGYCRGARQGTSRSYPDQAPDWVERAKQRQDKQDTHEEKNDMIMNHPVALAVCLAALSLAVSGACGQATSPSGPPAGLVAAHCTPGNCEIRVTVDNCNALGGIKVDKPLVDVTQSVNMRWTIVTPGFVFAPNGIQFDPTNPQFEPRNNPQPNAFHIHNKKSLPGDYYYSVNVKGCLPLDPWVRNLQ
jgi:hypothetical protein